MEVGPFLLTLFVISIYLLLLRKKRDELVLNRVNKDRKEKYAVYVAALEKRIRDHINKQTVFSSSTPIRIKLYKEYYGAGQKCRSLAEQYAFGVMRIRYKNVNNLSIECSITRTEYEKDFDATFHEKASTALCCALTDKLAHITQLEYIWHKFLLSFIADDLVSYSNMRVILYVLLHSNAEKTTNAQLYVLNKLVNEEAIKRLKQRIEANVASLYETHMLYFEIILDRMAGHLSKYKPSLPKLLLLRDEPHLFIASLPYSRERRLLYYLRHEKKSFRNVIYRAYKEEIDVRVALFGRYMTPDLASVMLEEYLIDYI